MTLLRSALFNLWSFGLSFILLPAGLFVATFMPRRMLGFAAFWARWLLAGLKPICGIDVAITGREHLPATGPALIASQHQSAFDTLVWLTLLPRCSYVLKQELLRIPLYGRLIRPAGMIAIDRSGGMASLKRLMRDGAAAAAAGRQIVIFPEGTRAAPGEALPLHPGIAALAAATNLPVIPVATDSGLFWGRRAFRKRPGTIRVAILPPLSQTLPRQDIIRGLEAAFRTPICG